MFGAHCVLAEVVRTLETIDWYLMCLSPSWTMRFFLFSASLVCTLTHKENDYVFPSRKLPLMGRYLTLLKDPPRVDTNS